MSNDILREELTDANDQPDLAVPDEELVIAHKDFRIRLADTEDGRNQASMLINKMYAWRGYGDAHQVKSSPSQITLTASDATKVIGTVTLRIDSPDGLLADEIFKPEIDVHRTEGAKVCELTKLAFDPDVKSKFALASLFHILFIYGRRMHACTDVFIEINPRHRRFYETMLGFKKQCELRVNPRVNAPAHLMWLNIDYVEQQIRLYGGTGGASEGSTRSLYPYFFSTREEDGIYGRLMSIG